MTLLHHIKEGPFINTLEQCYIQLYNVNKILVAEESLSDKKVKFALEQAMKAQRGSRGRALLFL
jgi:hypothetical protein